ncbi:MAG: DMT family transporter [Patescibacteria group bacterium]|nr:DMT family transporter [Patescibacteria group bacterium]MBU1953248.1 DMT family transporter [Patescibacteria group bacterium]
MFWLLLTFASAFSYSLTRILQKILLKDKDSDPFAFGFVFQIAVSIIFLVYTIITKQLEFPNLSGLAINILILCLFYSIGNILTFKAFKLAEVSEVSVLFASSTVWSVIAAVIMLGEKLTPKNILGIIIVVLGLIAINIKKSCWKINKGHLYALLGAMLFGVAFTNDAYIVGRYNSVSAYMMLAFALPAFTSILLKPQSVKNIPQFVSKNAIPRLFFCAIFYFLSALTIFSAYKLGGPASVISPIQQTSIIFTVIMGYLFLKERDRMPNKIIGTILAFVGVLLLI